MKRLAARVITAAAWVAITWAVGNRVRGPFADPSVPRDLVAGATAIGSAVTVQWAAETLEHDHSHSTPP